MSSTPIVLIELRFCRTVIDQECWYQNEFDMDYFVMIRNKVKCIQLFQVQIEFKLPIYLIWGYTAIVESRFFYQCQSNSQYRLQTFVQYRLQTLSEPHISWHFCIIQKSKALACQLLGWGKYHIWVPLFLISSHLPKKACQLLAWGQYQIWVKLFLFPTRHVTKDS